MVPDQPGAHVAVSTLVGARLDLPDALGAIKAAGFQFVEIAAMHNWVHLKPSDFVGRVANAADELAALCNQVGLTPVSFTADTIGSLKEQTAQVRALVEVAAATGMGTVTLMPAALDSPVQGDIARFGHFLESVRDVPVVLSLNTHLDTRSWIR